MVDAGRDLAFRASQSKRISMFATRSFGKIRRKKGGVKVFGREEKRFHVQFVQTIINKRKLLIRCV